MLNKQEDSNSRQRMSNWHYMATNLFNLCCHLVFRSPLVLRTTWRAIFDDIALNTLDLAQGTLCPCGNHFLT
jgi:hypothetical protein